MLIIVLLSYFFFFSFIHHYFVLHVLQLRLRSRHASDIALPSLHVTTHLHITSPATCSASRMRCSCHTILLSATLNAETDALKQLVFMPRPALSPFLRCDLRWLPGLAQPRHAEAARGGGRAAAGTVRPLAFRTLQL
jgi:hypothetical protein